jgi:hypothetical protein
MNDVIPINQKYQDDDSVKKRINETPHASLHARHVLALQASQKGIDRKNRKIWRMEHVLVELECEKLSLERKIRKYEKIMDTIEESSPEVVQQLLVAHGLAKAQR